MEIKELFIKPIDRPINGVIKADQLDAESIWQELDEYVVTKQLTEYFRKFFDAYLAAAEKPKDSTITARMGVWVSGFFRIREVALHQNTILFTGKPLKRPIPKPATRKKGR